jgi:hypothetical protein
MLHLAVIEGSRFIETRDRIVELVEHELAAARPPSFWWMSGGLFLGALLAVAILIVGLIAVGFAIGAG